MPIIHSNLLNSDLNWSDAEYYIGKKYLKWEEVTLNWENVDLTWDEVFILLEIVKRRGGSSGYPYRDEYLELALICLLFVHASLFRINVKIHMDIYLSSLF